MKNVESGVEPSVKILGRRMAKVRRYSPRYPLRQVVVPNEILELLGVEIGDYVMITAIEENGRKYLKIEKVPVEQ